MILNHDQALRSLRGTIVDRVGEQPLTEFARGENVVRYHLQFTSGRVLLERRDGQGWSTVEDTTPSAQAPEEIPSGPSSSNAMPARQSLADSLEAVRGSSAEENLRSKIGNYARRRNGVIHTVTRVSFGDGTVISWLRNHGQGSWIEIAE
jgi:hypothetical protein